MLFLIFAILVLVINVTFLRNIYNRVVNIADQFENLIHNYEKSKGKEDKEAGESESSGESTTKTTRKR